MWLGILLGVMAMVGTNSNEQDARLNFVRHLNLRYDLPTYKTADEWQRRAELLRLQVQIACGLFPMLPKTPLNPRRIVCYEDEDVIVERVALETFPNFYLTGNLYRPKKGNPPYPAVLHPHGHVPQPEGRLYERERIRAMAMAKLGFVVFAYDMVGYGDQFQVVHRAPETPHEHLWAISKGGVQTWNSIRVLDFLLSLPEVDKKRVGCCGSSGGGTQTFFLAAVDDRLALAVPTKMVSAHMQGGCICENPPLLRVDTCNPEIVALFAPKPMLLISDDGDWTKETPKYEFPFVRSIYRLLNAEDRCANAHFSEGHDFARGSREAYYNWAIRWLKSKGKPLSEPVKEPAMQLPDAQRLRVWGDDLPKPHNAVTWDALVEWLKTQASETIERMRPNDKKSLRQFQRLMRPALQVTLAVSVPTSDQLIVQQGERKSVNGLTIQQIWLGRKNIGDRIPAVQISPAAKKAKEAVLLVSEKGAAMEVWSGEGETAKLAKLLTEHFEVLAIDAFRTGMASGERKTDVQFFATYNRTDDAERVQDILTATAYLRQQFNRIHLVGIGTAGLWVSLAAPVTEVDSKVVMDAAQFDANDDDEFVKRLFIPCLRRIGDLRTTIALIAPRPLLIHNAHPNFPRNWAESAYKAANASHKLSLEEQPMNAEQLAEWLIKPVK
ncbi:MAG: acetylxylan esterase [Armatimonadota bacterium]